jgi:hypothetical protein
MRPRASFVVAVALLALVLTGSAFASDQPTILYPENEERVVSPGETVELRMFVDSDGGFRNVGLVTLSMNASFDTEYLRATSVEPGAYLEQGESTDVHAETNIDNAEGVIFAKQWRDPPRNGSTGTALFATVTFEVDEDAPETNTTVTFENSTASLVDDYEVLVYEHNATFVIEEAADTPSSDGSDEVDETGDGSGMDATGTDILLASVVGIVVVVGVTVVLRGRK